MRAACIRVTGTVLETDGDLPLSVALDELICRPTITLSSSLLGTCL